MIKNLAIIFVGGGLGSMSRFLIGKACLSVSNNFPLGTLSVNILSSLILGLTVGFSLLKLNLSPLVRLFITVGFCGGFSTFSSFSLETFELFKSSQPLLAIINIFSNVILCLIGIAGGIGMARLF